VNATPIPGNELAALLWIVAALITVLELAWSPLDGMHAG
jgi:hypothetical protein